MEFANFLQLWALIGLFHLESALTGADATSVPLDGLDDYSGRVKRQRNTAGLEEFRDWKTGEAVTLDAALNNLSIYVHKGEIRINATLIKGAVPELVKLYFNGGENDETRKMIFEICPYPCNASTLEKQKLVFCFIGQMDPANVWLQTQFELKNYNGKNEIAEKCSKAQKKQWPKFENKVLHGFQISYGGKVQKGAKPTLELSSSVNPEAMSIPYNENESVYVHLGEPGALAGFVTMDEHGTRNSSEENFLDRAWKGGLLKMENAVAALAFDLLGLIPQGGKLGIIGSGGKCALHIILKGDGLEKCFGKECEKSNPDLN
uniref:Uncharacterized protein n=1 Tax=Globodera pallida TaxID=36090 RepID=A0A183CHL8_GLOPA